MNLRLKPKPLLGLAGFALALLSTLNARLATGLAATTITTTNHCAYGANIG
jgi:hypothetical protein